ncbi:kinase-like protein [Annulohypoxylon maeteangense]|uniref:kinase-like protein n=1 Tax=Annulohypoxylon maeteangense TaxID=1927788 RepID=UPI0020072B4A|nr:kinase-like protein [Annulohypoxylon maeteangense]KAI0889151.1 kinase-like protein [Annulohypoxylon maeteangense]
MASNLDDWRSSLTSSDRYDNIQVIKAALDKTDNSTSLSQSGAFAIENEAYKNSTSRIEYDEICRNTYVQEASSSSQTPPITIGQDVPESPGITIGSYSNCHYVSSGVTAEVYRSETVALKVIVETRNIEPHNPFREAKILKLLEGSKPCIPLLETFRDQEQRFTLVFPFMPMSLESLIQQGLLSRGRIQKHFTDLFKALDYIHQQGMIHRDVKPSAVLLESADGPAYLSDFGTAWHPEFSVSTEPPHSKILDIGTGPYRAPEALFGDKAYGISVDMWGVGTMLAECCRDSPRPLFESRAAHEDGNQLGLILSIFKTIGSPTRESWPEATNFKTPPFDMYQVFEGRTWDDILPDVNEDFRKLIAALVVYNTTSRATASQALQFECMRS